MPLAHDAVVPWNSLCILQGLAPHLRGGRLHPQVAVALTGLHLLGALHPWGELAYGLAAVGLLLGQVVTRELSGVLAGHLPWVSSLARVSRPLTLQEAEQLIVAGQPWLNEPILQN